MFMIYSLNIESIRRIEILKIIGNIGNHKIVTYITI